MSEETAFAVWADILAKRRAKLKERAREDEMRQLEWLTGRDRLDIAVNGFPSGPLDRNESVD